MILIALFGVTIAGFLAHAFSGGGSEKSSSNSSSSSGFSSSHSSSLPELSSWSEILQKYQEPYGSSRGNSSFNSISYTPTIHKPRREVLLRTEIITEKFRAYPSEQRAIYTLGDEKKEYSY